MPHTSRQKRTSNPAQKRLQVTSSDGWTHVTSSNNVRRVMRTSRVPSAAQAKEEEESILGPAEAPARLTFDDLQTQYAAHRDRWVESETWKTLSKLLAEQMRERERIVLNDDTAWGPVDAIVCIGLGSPSGFLRDGWVDRRTVSMYQLAALDSMATQLSQGPDDSIPFSFPIYAQDPVFNGLDCLLLESLGITIVNDPVAFERITQNTLLFCPGAEKKHLELVLPSNPCLVFGGPLEMADSEVIQSYTSRVESRGLVPFTINEHAFWKMRLYFRKEEAQEEE
ncbi:hypothetical protein N7448_000805 [Penicillium atrosanguineum]|uniref:Phosphatidylinositol 3-kinase n=1 Tax=Penicillium atrosanguineum TaxID=1132637 RepID=UPI0023923F4C|nr:Phosphatidylinositol 3-kinase [Penicillium atrosanguineum]KAJ5149227.1 hypothetical protein N7448_000805 [Penicillium atrosanguineum]KAJ5304539.1 Phosphatidylinositol 3-kinase [Penicillium atrosanguineum]